MCNYTAYTVFVRKQVSFSTSLLHQVSILKLYNKFILFAVFYALWIFLQITRNPRRNFWAEEFRKIDDIFQLPDILQDVADRYPWFNAEVIGDRVIEVHFRYNDDFANHNANTIIPVWCDEFYSSPDRDRLGFILKDNIHDQ